MPTFAVANEKQTLFSHATFGSLAQLNRASDYGSEGYRFESYTSHKVLLQSESPEVLQDMQYLRFFVL